MGVEWWGRRDGLDHDEWQANWDNQLSSEEHNRVNKQGSKEDCGKKQGSEEHSLGNEK